MSEIIRIKYMVLRHAEPLVDQQTKRSLNVLTVNGVNTSLDVGQAMARSGFDNFYGPAEEVEFHIRYTPEFRGITTAEAVAAGMGRNPASYRSDDDLGLAVVKGMDLPKGIPYGPDFIRHVLTKNSGIENAIARNLAKASLELATGTKDRFNLLISHGPLVETSYGVIVGCSIDNIPMLALKPIQGYGAQVDLNTKSGTFSNAMVTYSLSPDTPIRVTPEAFFGTWR